MKLLPCERLLSLPQSVVASFFLCLLFLLCTVFKTCWSSKIGDSMPIFKIGYLLPEYSQMDAESAASTPLPTTNQTDQLFMIDSILSTHQAKMYTYNARHKFMCPERLSALDSAISFASQRLSFLFRELYGCHLEIDRASTKCDVSYGTRSFFELAKNTSRTLLVFGGSCDSTIKPIAESVQYFNLTMLSYTETDPTFSDQSKYYGYYRMLPGEEQHNYLRLHLIKKYNWTRVGTIYLTKAKYTLAHNLLIRELDKVANLTVSRSILENQSSNQYQEILKDFVREDIKIIIGIFDQNTALRLFCEIYKRHMYGDKYQWIILGSYNLKTLFAGFKQQHDSNCTIEQLHEALNGTLQTRVVQNSYEFELIKRARAAKVISGDEDLADKDLVDEEDESDNGQRRRGKRQLDEHYTEIVNEYMREFYENFDKNNILFENDCLNQYFHGYAFDLLLAIFKALSSLIESNKFSCSNVAFNRNIDWFHLLNSALSEISFVGMTGNVTFRKGARVGQIKMEQLIAFNDTINGGLLDLRESLIYIHDQNENEFHELERIRWHGKNAPRDHTIKVKLLNKISSTVFLAMSCLALVGILLAMLFLFFNIRFRKHRFIKMSSPYLNNLIIIGCLFSYTSIFFLGEYEDLITKSFFRYVCVVRVWLLTVGFTLAFGAMFSKTYRVHAILTNATLTKKVIKDYKLFGMVIFFLVIDMVILVNWQIFDPLKLVTKPFESKSDGEKIIEVENLVCESNHIKIWIGSLFTYKALLIIFGCFFAYETRHVKIAALNDSKYIGISVYNVLIMCSTGAAIAFIVDKKDAAFILITLFIFACTSITLCLVFLPKLLEVKQDPDGKKKQKSKNTFKKVQNSKQSNSIPRYHDSEDLDRKIKTLDEDNKVKSNLIEQANKKLEALLHKAKMIGVNYFEECMRLLNTEDLEIQKILNQINAMSTNNNNCFSTVNTNLLTVNPQKTNFSKVSNNVSNSNSLNVDAAANSASEATAENTAKTDTYDEVNSENYYDTCSNERVKIVVENVSSNSEEEPTTVSEGLLGNLHIVETTTSTAADEPLLYTNVFFYSTVSPPLSPMRSPKRKFNPPPHIIDLNDADTHSNFGDCYSFKVDI